jgi:hypothetical protein
MNEEYKDNEVSFFLHFVYPRKCQMDY